LGSPHGDRSQKPASLKSGNRWEIFYHASATRDTAARIFIENINWLFLHGSIRPSKAGLKRAIGRRWLWPHESGTYVKLTQAGADLFS
jgi:hypothetical protein